MNLTVSILLSLYSLLLLSAASAFSLRKSILQSRLRPENKDVASYTSSDRGLGVKSSHLFMSGGSSSSPLKVGIVGATGAVGETILSVMEARRFPVQSLTLFASERSAGKTVETAYGTITYEVFDFAAASKMDVLFLAVGADFSLEWGEKLAEAGVLVIDNSSAFRRRDDVPLVIPEINIHTARGKKLIANPNCTTAIALMALWPIHKKFTIKRAIISTYQAASGAGAPGMKELQDGMSAIVAGNKPENKVFAHQLPYNVIPHIDKFQENMYTKEEMKVTWESQKIMQAPEMKVSCTAVRIPTIRAHSEAITLECAQPVDPAVVQAMLRQAPGVKVMDDPQNNVYPMPLSATEQWDVEVGRIRRNDVFGEFGLDLFVSGDQLLRGAALNAVIIAEELMTSPATAAAAL